MLPAHNFPPAFLAGSSITANMSQCANHTTLKTPMSYGPYIASHRICTRGALCCGLLGVVLGALLQLLNGFVGTTVRLDGLLAIRGELGLPVALTGFLLSQGILLVLLVVLVFWRVLRVSEQDV